MVGQEDVAPGLGVVHGSTRTAHPPTSVPAKLVGYYVVQFRTLARGACEKRRHDGFRVENAEERRLFGSLDEFPARSFVRFSTLNEDIVRPLLNCLFSSSRGLHLRSKDIARDEET